MFEHHLHFQVAGELKLTSEPANKLLLYLGEHRFVTVWHKQWQSGQLEAASVTHVCVVSRLERSGPWKQQSSRP